MRPVECKLLNTYTESLRLAHSVFVKFEENQLSEKFGRGLKVCLVFSLTGHGAKHLGFKRFRKGGLMIVLNKQK